MFNIKIAENLKLLMKEKNINQTQLSERIGVAQSAISAWLSKKKEPSITSLWLLSDFFDTTVDFIIGRKDY